MSERPTHGFSLEQSNKSDLISSIVEPHKTLTITSSLPQKTKMSRKHTSPPVVKVVDPGQEQTGRWTREEHQAFLAGLHEYGKEWKKVAAKVKTRTVVQTRTHAQKYFQKLQKGLVDNIDFDMGILESKKSTSAKKRSARQKQGNGQDIEQTSVLSTNQQHQAMLNNHLNNHLNNQAAAQLMAISQLKSQSEESMTGSNKPPPPASFFSLPSETKSQQSFDRNEQLFQSISQHHGQMQYNPAGVNAFGTTSSLPQAQKMRIIPPKPEETLKKNKLPEPSPAACGSRKVIELAAAEMLAAVGNNSVKAFEKFAGNVTPPLPSNGSLEKFNLSETDAGSVNRMVPVRLQIVNPDNLAVPNEMNRNKRRNVEKPTTPWDGQLAALGSEIKIKGKKEDITDSIADNSVQSIVGSGNGIHVIDHPLNQNATCNRSALHQAVCDGSLEEVKHIINTLNGGALGITSNFEPKMKALHTYDENGFTPIHSAVSLSPMNIAVVMTELVLSFSANAASMDRNGNSPLHWASRAGNHEVIQILILKGCPLDLQNEQGESALHWAMRAGKTGLTAVKVLLANGARVSLFNNRFQRPIDVAANGFNDIFLQSNDETIEEEYDDRKVDAKRQSRMNLLCVSPQSRTLVLHHSECLEHIPKSEADWEAPDRVTSIMNAIRSNIRDYEVQISHEFGKASLELLSRVHSAEYLTFVNNLSKELEKRSEELDNKSITKSNKDTTVVPFTPMVQRTMGGEDIEIKKGSHSDTSFSSGSLRAARRAAGAVQHAVDCVLVGRNRNAFCVVRPPGHHAGINGLLAGGESCGFCIFNNVAAGAMHALSDEGNRPKCERCAIVDIDAHHGNGTEEIVKRCDDPGRLFFFSVHLFDNDMRKGKQNGFKFYPGTGSDDDVAHNIVNVPIAPMWREKEISQLTKTTPYNFGEGRNTRNKSKLKAASALKDSSDVDRSESPSKSTPSHYIHGTGREAYRRAISQRLIPALRAFNPDLIIISIGFDASKGDVGNARHFFGGKELEGINLEPQDYAWTTRRIMEVANICCEGRVVSVLEGGYGSTLKTDTTYLSDNDQKGKKRGNHLDKSTFSACAIGHLRALIDPFDAEKLH